MPTPRSDQPPRHHHPKIDAAIRRQLGKIAHCSALGLANEPASRLAERLIKAVERGARSTNPQSAVAIRSWRRCSFPTTARLPWRSRSNWPTSSPVARAGAAGHAFFPARRLSRRHRGRRQPRSYRSVHRAYAGLLFKSDAVMAPYCYRCRFNRAKPERADARAYRKCHWECVGKVEQRFERQRKKGNPYAAFILEPLIQGAAGMIPSRPAGSAARLRLHAVTAPNSSPTRYDRLRPGRPGERGIRADCRAAGTSQFGLRTSDFGLAVRLPSRGVQPDFLCLAKGLTGGYLRWRRR